MTLARKLELTVGIPAWLIGVSAYFELIPQHFGAIAIFVFLTVWVYRFISDEREFFRG